MSGWYCRWLATLLIVLSGVAAAPAAFAETMYSFNLPEQQLADSLRAIGQQTDMNILFEPDAVKNARSPALRGQYTVDEAIRLVLAGTKLEAQHTAASNVVIKVKSARGNAAPATSADTPSSGARLAQSNSSSSQSASPAGPQNTATTGSTSAPSKSEGLEEIIVTGTNISGVDNKTVPLLSFDKEAIERSGFATLSDFITALPQNVKSANNSPDGVLAGGNGTFNNIENSTAANLRGVGASSTLTLINGHRVAPSAFGTGVDLSMIPLSGVERIDVLTDGSSAVYGSDAVGGVINIILRKDFDGQETRVRLDTLSRGGGELKQIGQSVGRTWSTGSVLGAFQFEDANVLRADQRTYTASLPQPTDVLPTAKRYSGIISAHQDVTSSFEVFTDAVLAHNTGERTFTAAGALPMTQIIDDTTNSTSANVGFRWQPFGDWHLEGSALGSRVNSPTREDFSPSEPPYVNGQPYIRAVETIKELDLKLDGTVWQFNSGSSVKIAVGGSSREEQFAAFEPFADFTQSVSRHVHAAFAEIYAPLITPANALPWARKLDLSAAVRDDSYSDFGSKTNPRFGVFYAPIDQIGLRVAYSTSFRAPDPSEKFDAAEANRIVIESGFPQPGDPTGVAPVLFYGNQVLNPETSRNLTAGLDFTPTTLPTTRFSLNYYRIVYSNRITIPPLNLGIFINQQVYGPLIRQFADDAAVAAFVAGLKPPQQVFDASAGHTGLTGIRYAYSYGAINATRERTEGLDLGAHSVITLTTADKLVLELNATYLRDLETTFCQVCTTTDLANTVGEPLKLRLRAAGGWSNGILNANAAINYANSYSDTNLVPPGRIPSLTTIDLNAGYLFLKTRTTLSIALLNALNSNPPHTAPGFQNIGYDPSNADPRGRTISLQARQSW